MNRAGSSEHEAVSPERLDLVLASTSPYRRMLLERLGIPFRSKPPICDERALEAEEPNPLRLAEKLAHIKASSVAAEEPGATIIGCDQVLSLSGKILGKPGTTERAIDQLLSLAGQQHELITALVVLSGTKTLRHTDVTRLWMRRLSRPALERYVLADQPLDCAGSFKIESRGITLFERIECNDQTAITGLPLIALVSILIDLGYDFP